LIIYPFIICLLFYWGLFYWGRITPENPQTPTTELESNPYPPVPSLPVRPIELAEETHLRNCFPWSVYHIQNIEYRPQAVICRGQLRTNPSSAYEQIKANIEAQFSDRFLIIFQEGMNGKPFFVLVPNTRVGKQNSPRERERENLTRPGLALLLLVVTFVTTTLVGTKIAGVDLTKLESNLSLVWQGLPYALGLMTILGIHELGHYLIARLYKIKSTLPYFIPAPFFLGTFGAFIQMRSPVPNRRALFDVSIAGPIAGLIVTFPLILWGLAHSQVITMADKTTVFNPTVVNPKYSILFALLCKLVLGNNLTYTSAINLHPVAIAGFIGLIATAFNLMPVGQLDGGHIVHAMFGQRTAILIGQISRFLLLLLALIQQVELLFGAIILLFIPLIDEPALNDVTELDTRRDILGFLAMALLVLIVIPLPQGIAKLLQI
jgi:membrane-associated protease RseP (regulator of RpoE activity)